MRRPVQSIDLYNSYQQDFEILERRIMVPSKNLVGISHLADYTSHVPLSILYEINCVRHASRMSSAI